MSAIENSLFKLRVRYRKAGRLRFLGHLEVAKTIERSVRRAGFSYAVTQGFSPHMRIAYSAALPVGYASEAEFFDVVLTEYVPVGEALERLAAASPRDLAPCEMAYVDMRAPTLGALIVRQDYRASLELSDGADAAGALADARAGLERLCSEGTVPYMRGSKRKLLKVSEQLASYVLGAGPDPRSLSLDFSVRVGNEGSLRLEMLLAAWDARFGSGDPDRPLVSSGMQALSNFSRVEVARVRQYGVDGAGNPVSPMAQRPGLMK